MFWLILASALIVLYFAGLYISPFGEMLAFLCILIGKPLLRVESLLEVFKEKLVTANSKHIGLHTVTCLIALVFASIILAGDVSGSIGALTALYNGTVDIPSLPPVFTLAMGALFIACPALLGMCMLEIKGIIPDEARIFTLLQEKAHKWFNRFVTIGLCLAIPDSVLYYALRPLFLANHPNMKLVTFLQFAINAVLGLLIPLISMIALYVVVLGAQTFFALTFGLLWFGVSAVTDVLDFLSRFFAEEDHISKLNGIRPSGTVVDAEPTTPLLQAAPTIAAIPGFTGTLDEIVLDAIPVSLKTTPYPGRSHEHFPISGPEFFVTLINKILDELKKKAPDYYEQCLEYLPKAEYNTCIRPPALGRSDGLFAFYENEPYDLARFVVLHETGHCVWILQHDDVREEMANDYANKAVAKIARYEVEHDNA